jgi:hypothetical protein
MKVEQAIAAERLPYGVPVRSDSDGLRISTKLTDMCGVARRGDANRDAWEAGDMVDYATDGPIRTDIVADVSLVLGGIERRLLRAEPHCFTLSGGKIIG